MKKLNIRFTSVLLLIVLVLGAVSISAGGRRNYFVYGDSLEEVAAVVDGNGLTLRDLAFYIAYEENLIEEEAVIYDPQDTGKYWRICSEGSSTRSEGKAAAMELAIHDAIFYQLAQAEGIELNEAEERYAANVQADFWSDFGENISRELGVDKADLEAVMRKLAYAQKYQSLLAKMQDVNVEEYDISGEKYQELLKEHDWEIREKVWERVHFGSITVAH